MELYWARIVVQKGREQRPIHTPDNLSAQSNGIPSNLPSEVAT